jgi:hypothetical protein
MNRFRSIDHSFPDGAADRPTIGRPGGFTLIETILALGVTFMILTAAFGIVTSCLELGDTVTTTRTSREDAAAVEDLFRGFFGSLPDNAVIECKLSGSLSTTLTELRIQNPPAVAGAILNPGPNEVLVFQTTQEPGGYLRLGVGVSEGLIGTPRPGAVRGFAVAGQISMCRWRFFQADRNEWQEKWSANMGRPRFAELTFAQNRAPAERWVFPIPVYAPASAANQNPNQNPKEGGEGGGGGGGRGGEGNRDRDQNRDGRPGPRPGGNGGNGNSGPGGPRPPR